MCHQIQNDLRQVVQAVAIKNGHLFAKLAFFLYPDKFILFFCKFVYIYFKPHINAKYDYPQYLPAHRDTRLHF